jgi:hypothetical protein
MAYQDISLYARLFIAVSMLGVFVVAAVVGILRQRRRDRRAHPQSQVVANPVGAPSATADLRRAERPQTRIERLPSQPQERRAA